jgi:flavorubredoxin
MPVCAAVTARQLSGFGITDGALIKKPGESLHGADFDIQFVSYPSEMHLREGLLAFDARRGLLFSEDLFIRRGQMSRPTRPLAWEEEIQAISPAQIPPAEAREALQADLRKLPVRLVAPGHGPLLLG